MCPLSWQSGVAETSLSNARFFKFEYRLQETRNEKKKNQQKAFQLRSIFGWLWFSFMGFILFFFFCVNMLSWLLLGKRRVLLVLHLGSDSSCVCVFCKGGSFMKNCKENYILWIAKAEGKPFKWELINLLDLVMIWWIWLLGCLLYEKSHKD